MRFSGSRLGSLQQAGRGIVGGNLARDALVVVQTASALVLLVGSALLVRSFWQLSSVDAGYDTEGIFTFQIAAGRPDLTGPRLRGHLARGAAVRSAAPLLRAQLPLVFPGERHVRTSRAYERAFRPESSGALVERRGLVLALAPWMNGTFIDLRWMKVPFIHNWEHD